MRYRSKFRRWKDVYVMQNVVLEKISLKKSVISGTV